MISSRRRLETATATGAKTSKVPWTEKFLMTWLLIRPIREKRLLPMISGVDGITSHCKSPIGTRKGKGRSLGVKVYLAPGKDLACFAMYVSIIS